MPEPAAPTAALIRLVYASTRLPFVTDTEVVDGIVLVSMRRNREVDVTGCLWFGPGHFFQVLEGPTRHVDDTYDRICRDRRHTAIDLLERRPIDARNFERFSMRVVCGNESEALAELIAEHATESASSRTVPTQPSIRTRVDAAVRALVFWRESPAG